MVIYPGTFDPITIGHLDVLHRSINSINNKITIAVADIKDKKQSLFTSEERIKLIENSLLDLSANGKFCEKEDLIVKSFNRKKIIIHQIQNRIVKNRQEILCENIFDHINNSKEEGQKTVIILDFNELLVNFAKKLGVKLIIRGIRASSDFDYEFSMACANKRLNNQIETVFVPSSEDKQFISSSIIKSIASLDGDVSSVVTKSVSEALILKYKKNYE